MQERLGEPVPLFELVVSPRTANRAAPKLGAITPSTLPPGSFIHRISGGKIAEERGAGTGGSELLGQRLEQEMLERERVEQVLQVARRIQQASLPKIVPRLEGWQITPY